MQFNKFYKKAATFWTRVCHCNESADDHIMHFHLLLYLID